MEVAIKKTAEESLVMAILELAGTVDKREPNSSIPEGITTQQWLVMLHLACDPNIPNLSKKKPSSPCGGWLPSDLADALNVSRPYMTTLVNTLIDKGVIEKREDDKDQRKKRLFLTARGKSAVQKLQSSRQKANQQLFQGVSSKDREVMLKGLRKCLENLGVPMMWA